MAIVFIMRPIITIVWKTVFPMIIFPSSVSHSHACCEACENEWYGLHFPKPNTMVHDLLFIASRFAQWPYSMFDALHLFQLMVQTISLQLYITTAVVMSSCYSCEDIVCIMG